MNDKSIIVYDHGYALAVYEYDIAIIHKSDRVNLSKRMISYQLYNKLKIKVDQKTIRFNMFKYR